MDHSGPSNLRPHHLVGAVMTNGGAEQRNVSVKRLPAEPLSDGHQTTDLAARDRQWASTFLAALQLPEPQEEAGISILVKMLDEARKEGRAETQNG